MTTELLEKDSKTPIHHQLYKIMKERIERGIYPESSMIPSETDLQKEFDVSRITVRRAMSDLEHDGFVNKKRGQGTIVLPRKDNRDLAEFKSFSWDARTKGNRPGSIILACKTVEANVKVIAMLKLSESEKVVHLKRLRLLNGKIIGLHETYVSLRFGFTITEDDFDTNTSLYDFIEQKGIVLGSADETVEAKIPNNDVRKELYMEENKPIFYKERVTYTLDGTPIEYSENSYIADRYKYNIHLDKVR